jgi:hypothetical protein
MGKSKQSGSSGSTRQRIGDTRRTETAVDVPTPDVFDEDTASSGSLEATADGKDAAVLGGANGEAMIGGHILRLTGSL